MSAAVHDVPACFRAIPPRVRRSPLFGSTEKYLGAHHKATGDFVGEWDFSFALRNRLGSGEHFQGAQRVGRRLVLSGGINRGAVGAVLIVIDMGSRAAHGPWALPAYAGGGFSHARPDPRDASFHVVSVDRERWHAGGIQAADGIVAVPCYLPGQRSSIVAFVDFNGDAPRRLTPHLTTGGMEAKAVGLARVRGGRRLLVVWDDERLDFYLGPPGAGPQHLTWAARLDKLDLPAEFYPRGFPRTGTYQSVNLVRDLKDEALYLVCTRNTYKWAPYLPGSDFADLYRLHWPDFTGRPRVAYVDSLAPPADAAGASSKQMYCYDEQCNFAGPAGIYTEAPDRMWIYAGWHWLHDGNRRFAFNEYSYV